MDWTAKLSDMGMSAVNLIRAGPSPWYERVEDAIGFEQIKQDLLSVVYAFISLLSTCSEPRLTKIPVLIKALAEVV